VLRIGKWLPEYGWEPVILTPDYTFSERIDNDNLVFVDKYFKKVYRSSGIKEKLLITIADKRKRNLLSKFLRWSYIYNLQPDKSILWFNRAVSAGLEIIEKEDIRAIWSTIGPAVTGLIGAELKRLTGVPLLIDYRDPWTLNPYRNYSKARLQKNIDLEKKMLEYADAVTATSDFIKEGIVKNNYFKADKTFVVTNGIEQELQWVDADYKELLLNENKFNITYTGAFYGDRQPFSFLEGLKLFIDEHPDWKNKIQFNIIGNLDPSKNILKYCRRIGLEPNLNEIGLVQYRNAMEYLKQSDLLLLVNGQNDESKIFIPGKLFDYLATIKPIMFVGEGQPAEIISEINSGETVQHEPCEIKNALCRLIINEHKYQYIELQYGKYLSKNISKNIVAIFDQICDSV